MTDECELIVEYDMVVRLGKCWIQINIHDVFIFGTVDGAGPTNMSGDFPDKKSQLDLRPFGVGVPAVGRTVVPWPGFRTEASKITLLVAMVWQLQQAKEGAWEVLTHGGWDDWAPWKPVIACS